MLRPTARLRRDEGQALILALLCGWLGCTLGFGYLVLAETESLRAKAWAERARSEAASRDVLAVAAAWFTAPAEEAWLRPEPDEWKLEQRRGDSDGDGAHDEACDGATDAGRWSGWPVDPLDPGTPIPVACGDPRTPDLLLDSGPFLEKLASTLGPDVVIERLAIFGAPVQDGRRVSTAEIACTVSVRRGEMLVARTTITGRVQPLPVLLGDEVLAAGGDVELATGCDVHWGVIAGGGDVALPPLGAEGFPLSGLPRKHDLVPVGWATGGATDWDYATWNREYVLTELLGQTRLGRFVLPGYRATPRLADPWLGVRAGELISIGGSAAGRKGDRQPFPYDPRRGPIADDLSHLSMSWGPVDALLGGAVQRLADLARPGASGSGAEIRRFSLASSAGEPKWRESAAGAARTATEWLATLDGRPAIVVFLAGDVTKAPKVMHVGAFDGILVAEAGRVVVTPAGAARVRGVHMPGEPFRDLGVDVDHDAAPEPETTGNARWDCDLDADLALDDDPPEAWLVEALLGPNYGLPYRDQDPSLLASGAHEPFLNLDYPADADDLAVTVSPRAGLGDDARAVRDLDGDGTITPGFDAFTTIARDAEGAELRMPVHVRGLVANLAGDVVVASGCTLHGAVRASGDVIVESGARVLFDSGFARDGRPTDLALPRALLSDVAWASTGPPRRGAPAQGPQEEPAAEDDEEKDEAGDPGNGAAGGGGNGSPAGPGAPGGGGAPRDFETVRRR